MKRLLIFISMLILVVGLITGISYGAGDKRFTLSDSLVNDKKTGLAWTRNANMAGKEMTWDDASKFIEKLKKQKYTGLQCWRLPTKEELQILIDYAESQGYNTHINELFSKIGFRNVQPGVYWSFTSYADDTTNAWSVSMIHGGMSLVTKADTHYVWPVCDYEKEKRRTAEKRRKAKEQEEKEEKIKQQQAQREAKRNQLLLKCDGKILSQEDFMLGKNPYADKGKCVEFTAVTFQMTSANTGLFKIGNNEIVFIEFKETFRGPWVQGIAKIKGLYNYTTRAGIPNQVPHLEMLEIGRK